MVILWKIYLQDSEQQVVSSSKPLSWRDYEKYTDFFRDLVHCTGLDSRTVDKGLWVRGDKLKRKLDNAVDKVSTSRIESQTAWNYMKGIKRQDDRVPSFREVYDALKNYGPATCVSSRGTKYIVRAEVFAGRPTIIGCPRTGDVRIHEDCWGQQLTCKHTRAGGIYNGAPSIYDWFNEKS